MLAGLFQGDHLAPPTVASSYTSRERSSTSPTGTATATASSCPLAGQDEAGSRLLGPGMDRDALIASPDLHRAQPLSHLHDAAHPLPVNPVARSLPADEAVSGHLPVLPQLGRQCIPAGHLPQVWPLLGQHLARDPEGYYRKRQAIERVFKSLKESRRLERHCIRGLRRVTLHSLMSALAFQATVLVRILMGEAEHMRWLVRQVA